MAANECFDLLIIGGGINGAGIARDATGRDLKVLLVEQSDLASSTSSASTKLIHGGLRYLETFEFRLVREALIERERLLSIAPHIIRPLQFVLPHVEGLRPRWQIRAGLFLYDHLGGRKRLPASRSVRLDSNGLGAGLKPHIRHGFSYSDCWVDDSRLVVLNVLDAEARGAQIRVRTRFTGAAREATQWRAQLVDERSGAQSQVCARALVNAAGPWVEKVLQGIAGIQSDSQVRLVKGSHIVVPRMYVGEHAYLLQNPDGRVVFTIPYEQHYTLIGTTDVAFESDPGPVHISQQEIVYLCDTVNHYFTAAIAPAQVHWSYAGVRPLSDDEAANASKVTRDYKLELDADGRPPLLSVFGGKITTYRRLAEAALGKLTPLLGGGAADWTRRVALPGGNLARADFAAFLQGVRQRWPFLSPELAHRLARAYGTRISEVLGTAQALADLGQQFGAGLSLAEVEYLRRHEWAHTAEDILWRRTKLGLHMQAQEIASLQQYLAGC